MLGADLLQGLEPDLFSNGLFPQEELQALPSVPPAP